MRRSAAEIELPGRSADHGLSHFLRSIAGSCRPHWRLGLVVLLALLLQTAFRACLPLAYELLFDRALGVRDHGFLALLLGALGAGLAVNAAAGLAQDRAAARLAARVMNDLRRSMFRCLQRLPTAELDRSRSGDLMSRFTNDLGAIEGALTRGLVTAAMSALVLVVSAGLLFAVEWRLALLTLAALCAVLSAPRLLSGRAQSAAYRRKVAEAEVAAALQEDIRAATVIRVFGLESERRDRFRGHLDDLWRKSTKAHFDAALVGRAATLGTFGIQLLVLGVGGYLAIGGQLTIGALASFVALLLNIANASSHLSTAMPDVIHAAGGLRRIDELLHADPGAAGPLVDEPGERRSSTYAQCGTLPRFRRELVFDQVSFTYGARVEDDQAGRPVLDGVSFRLGAGESLGIVGASGSGKSTLVKLLVRLYEPDAGRITLDGRDLRLTSAASLRRQIALVPQETILFDASVGDNIRLGKLGASDAEVEAAAREAGIHHRIQELPRGYDTVLGENGSSLSGGERQRLAIARAIVRRPAILILDEATSGLDPATAREIQATLEELSRSTTVIAVTHRISSAATMDQILVLDRGRVAEMGDHRQLRRGGGVYDTLWRQRGGHEGNRRRRPRREARPVAVVPLAWAN